MTDCNPIRDEEGRVPDISTQSDGQWIGWFGLNVDIARMHEEAQFFIKYDMEARDEESEPRTLSGKFEDMDWAVDHDWYRSSTHWRGWIPIKDYENILPTPNFLDFDEGAPSFESVSGLWHMQARYSTDLTTRFEVLEEIVAQCAALDWGGVKLTTPPPLNINHRRVNDQFDTEFELQTAAAAVRRGIADRMGWLAWFRAAIPQPILQEKLPFISLNNLLLETRIEYKRKGYIVQPADSLSEINIPLWLSHHLPVFYRWRFNEASVERLSRMDPRIVAGDSSGGRVTMHYVEKNDNFREVAQRSNDYDDYFQLKQPVVPHQNLSFEMDAVLYVIDFQGWGRRLLLPGTDFAMYSERFFFMTEDGEGGEGTSAPNVIFWRWRKKALPISRRLEPFPTGDCNESFLREIFKDAFAPRRGRAFDEETGRLLPADETLTRIEPFSDHRRDPSYTFSPDQLSVSTVSDDSIPDLETAESPSLLDRLGLREDDIRSPQVVYTPVGNVTSWRNTARMAERRLQRHEPRLIRDNATLRSARSRSPRRPLARNIRPDERPLALFRRKLQEIAPYISHDEPRESLGIFLNWNPNLLAKGYLRIAEERSEVRFRYFANAPALGIRHVSQLLKFALVRRLNFQIAIKEADIATFAPRTVSEADRMLGRTIYGPDYVETPLEPSSPMIVAANYIVRVGELLKRPHAPAFIGLGGAASWLAQRWGGEVLISRFMEGPSVQTTIFRRGASDIYVRRPKGLVWDQPSGREIDLLFGLVADPAASVTDKDRWLYPPPHIIDEFCDNWTGEWNWVMDKIYSFISNEIMKVPGSWAPKSRGAWKKWLRTYNGGSYAPSNTLTEQHVADIMKGIRLADLPPTWNDRALREIYLPESPDD